MGGAGGGAGASTAGAGDCAGGDLSSVGCAILVADEKDTCSARRCGLDGCLRAWMPTRSPRWEPVFAPRGGVGVNWASANPAPTCSALFCVRPRGVAHLQKGNEVVGSMAFRAALTYRRASPIRTGFVSSRLRSGQARRAV